MTPVNGELQAQFMTRIRGLDPQRCLVIPVDVGKAIAMTWWLITMARSSSRRSSSPDRDRLCGVVRGDQLRAAERDALVIRVGVESAGHYHRTLVARLRAAAWRSSNSTRARPKMYADNGSCAR